MPKNKSIKIEFNDRQNIVKPDVVPPVKIKTSKLYDHHQAQVKRQVFQRCMPVFVPRKNTYKKSKVFGIIGNELEESHN